LALLFSVAAMLLRIALIVAECLRVVQGDSGAGGEHCFWGVKWGFVGNFSLFASGTGARE
jgi:hypothetical protein